jgi:transcriptional regulator with XRE-family HTH domain
MVKKYHSALALRLGRNIAAFRRSAALKQEQLAELIEVEISTVSRYETGVTLPSLVTLAKLAEVLHCTMAELLVEKIPADSPEAIRIEAMLELLLPAERKMVIDVIETLVAFSRQQKAMISRKH